MTNFDEMDVVATRDFDKHSLPLPILFCSLCLKLFLLCLSLVLLAYLLYVLAFEFWQRLRGVQEVKSDVTVAQSLIKARVRGKVGKLHSPETTHKNTIYTPGNGTLSYMISSRGEFSAFSAANAIHNFSSFCSTRYPSLLGGQRWYGMRDFAQHLYTQINKNHVPYI